MDTATLAKEYTDFWATADWPAWARTTAPGYRFRLGPDDWRDLAGTIAWGRAFLAAFPDYGFTVEHTIAEPRRLVLVATWWGTHTGALAGLPPTGRAVRRPWVKVLELDAAGLVLEDRQYHDTAALLTDLGAGPA